MVTEADGAVQARLWQVSQDCGTPTGVRAGGLQTPWGSVMFSHTLGV
jgi:hypothetical protein